MGIRETHKDIELAGKRWRIGRLDALTGNYLALKLLGKMGHVLAGITAGVVTDYRVLFVSAITELGSFTASELYEVQSTALSVCSELTMVGGVSAPIPVRTSDGRWGMEGIQDDPMTVMALTAHAIAFNLLPFFEGEALKSILESFKAYSIPFSLQTSTSTSTPR